MPDTETLAALRPTRCAICGTTGDATELYPANFDPNVFNAEIFSARRFPDGIRCRLVRCVHCGLVRSDPVAGAEILAKLYAESTFTYDAEVDSLRATYGRYLRTLQRYGAHDGALLEVGCGNGFFLEEARKQGYTVRGVEPSAEAIAKADPSVRNTIVCDIMRPGLFAADRFDVICIFQTFDHLPDPGGVLDECRRVLKPGGCCSASITMYARSRRGSCGSTARLSISSTRISITRRRSGASSPITDLRCATSSGVQHHPLHYLIRLVPMPRDRKQWAVDVLRRTAREIAPLRVPLGNMYLVARKPGTGARTRMSLCSTVTPYGMRATFTQRTRVCRASSPGPYHGHHSWAGSFYGATHPRYRLR